MGCKELNQVSYSLYCFSSAYSEGLNIFLWLYNISSCIYATALSIHMPIGHLSCLHIVAIVFCAIMIIGMYSFFLINAFVFW